MWKNRRNLAFLGIKVINFSSLIRLVESSGYGWGCMGLLPLSQMKNLGACSGDMGKQECKQQGERGKERPRSKEKGRTTWAFSRMGMGI